MTSRATPTALNAAPSAGSPGEFSMERQYMTMRALLGAGSFAVAMVAMSAGNASAATDGCLGEQPTVCGHVFTETGSGEPDFQVGEGTGNITVVVTTTGGDIVGTATPSNPTSSGQCADVASVDCGYYYFDLPEGDYLICLEIDSVRTGCKEASGGVQGQIVDLPVTDSEEPVDAEQPYTVSGNGTGTPGYWKNHPEMWPDSITVGGVTYYKNGTPSISEAIAKMGKVSKDKTITMFASLISAKLNTATNNYDCIAGTLFQADKWLTTYPVGSGVTGSSEAWEVGEPLHSKLDDYNNGKLCAPHRN
jgi:hypothetical protein